MFRQKTLSNVTYTNTTQCPTRLLLEHLGTRNNTLQAYRNGEHYMADKHATPHSREALG